MHTSPPPLFKIVKLACYVYFHLEITRIQIHKLPAGVYQKIYQLQNLTVFHEESRQIKNKLLVAKINPANSWWHDLIQFYSQSHFISCMYVHNYCLIMITSLRPYLNRELSFINKMSVYREKSVTSVFQQHYYVNSI